MPRRKVSTRIQISQNRPKAIAAIDSVSATALTRRRLRALASRPASTGPMAAPMVLVAVFMSAIPRPS